MTRPPRKRRFKIPYTFMDRFIDFCRSHPHIKAEQMQPSVHEPIPYIKETK